MQSSNVANRAYKILNLAQYKEINRGDFVGNFGHMIKPTSEHQYVLRMIVKHAHSDFEIPDEISWVTPLLMEAYKFQKEVIKINHLCCYVTIRHGIVSSHNDDVWHVDGFSTKISHIPEQNYIISNCYPTEVAHKAISFPLGFDPLIHNIHSYIQNRISKYDIQNVGIGEMWCVDPYVIHRRPIIPSGVIRTFVRISFTPIEIMDDNNTPNPLLQMPKYNRDGVEIRNKLLDYDKV